MPGFVVELYLPAARLDTVAASVRDAAAQLARDGEQVRCVRSVYVPADETCLLFLEAGSIEAARRAVELAALPVERLLDAVEQAL